ncbi:hypothetical protein E2C01_080532 [Portunus trituberculatus]|uniref:Uncharacterized protein n=1 Tax=Portunus trituberculatus TaxID=210409 RepID=A0A5B7ITQ5_PORTR|nr:hypothetical protein [Portunus trituberculatus]
MWQVKFAPYKTQLLNITRSSVPLSLNFSGRTLAPQDEVEVLGITYDCRLTFKSHIEQLAREASGKLASLRRMLWLLNNRGLEYACLAWGGTARKHLVLIEKVQEHSAQLIKEKGAAQEPRLEALQKRRDVAGLTVVLKVQVKQVNHLQPLRQPQQRPLVGTRAVT